MSKYLCQIILLILLLTNSLHANDIKKITTQKIGISNRDCSECVNDYTAYGSPCCDTAWDEFGIDCETL